MEVSLAALSYPTVVLPVDSYVYRFLSIDNQDIIDEFNLHPFEMKVQGIDRTFADKVFAVCDYYLQGKTKRYSRHIYDIHMLSSVVELNDDFKDLVNQVRETRSQMSICPSAKDGVNISELLDEIIEKEIFKNDYLEITTYFQNHPVSYETAIETLRRIADSGVF